MVTIVGTISLPDELAMVVRLRCAPGSRNLTKSWGYAHFHRELIKLFQRQRFEILGGI